MVGYESGMAMRWVEISVFMDGVWWVGMYLIWNMKGIGNKGWHNICICMINLPWLFEIWLVRVSA